MRSLWRLLTGLLILSGCGETPPARAPDANASPGAGKNADTVAEETAEPELSDEAAALIAETEGAPDGTAASGTAAPGTAAPAETAGRGKGYDLVYRVKPNELRVEVLKASFTPTARAVRVRDGWGVEVTLEVVTTEALSLSSSEWGPMAFAATVLGAAEDKTGDARGTMQEVQLQPNTTKTFKRVWPGPAGKPLRAGQDLVLQVGLWGLGPSPETRKAALRFFEVKLNVGAKGGVPLVNPPK